LLKKIENSEWDSINKDWTINIIRTTFTYNENNNVTQELKEYWDEKTKKYEKNREDNYMYDSNNLKIEYIYKLRNAYTNNLQNYEKKEYFYNNKAQLTIELDYIWGVNKKIWHIEGNREYYYNINGKLISEQSHRCDTPSTIWINQTNELYVYDKNDCLKTYDYYTNWSISKSLYENHTQALYFYKEDNTSILDELFNTNYPFSPNPVKDKLFIQISEFNNTDKIQIIDLNGRKLLETELKETIDVSSLSKGIYILKIGNRQWKFVKE
jgi:hypothetical protein